MSTKPHAYQKCTVNPAIKCVPRQLKWCPLETRWLELVTLWATTIEGHSNDWATDGIPDFRSAERKMVRTIEIPRLLEYPDQVIEYCNSGVMTKLVCWDLIRSGFLWRETRKGFNKRQSEGYFKRRFKWKNGGEK